jgi:hypothetical protein
MLDSIVGSVAAEQQCLCRELQQKYPAVCNPNELEALFSSGPERSFDLYYDAVKKSEWPTRDYSVKTLAKFSGFQWRDPDPSGASSIQRFDEWVNTRDPALKQLRGDEGRAGSAARYPASRPSSVAGGLRDSLRRVPPLTFMPRPNRPVESGYRVFT